MFRGVATLIFASCLMTALPGSDLRGADVKNPAPVQPKPKSKEDVRIKEEAEARLRAAIIVRPTLKLASIHALGRRAKHGPTGRVRGTILTPSGKPAGGAHVFLAGHTAHTGSHGGFGIVRIPVGGHLIHVQGKDPNHIGSAWVRINSGQVSNVVIQLHGNHVHHAHQKHRLGLLSSARHRAA